jgi:hypothetical protein
VGLIRDANFTGDNVEGVEVIAGNAAAGWHDPSFGDTENDLLLQTVMSSIRWSDAASLTVPDVTLRFGLLQPGTRYKLQLLFAEHGWPRGFDVFIDGTEFLDDFSPAHYQGGYPPTNGVVVTHSFVATRADLTVLLDGRGVATPEISDHNALLQGATLEDLGPAPVAPRITAISLEAAGVKITLESLAGSTYRLRYKQHLADPGWINVPGAVTATGATTALTDGDPSHRAPPQGYWQVVVE